MVWFASAVAGLFALAAAVEYRVALAAARRLAPVRVRARHHGRRPT